MTTPDRNQSSVPEEDMRENDTGDLCEQAKPLQVKRGLDRSPSKSDRSSSHKALGRSSSEDPSIMGNQARFHTEMQESASGGPDLKNEFHRSFTLDSNENSSSRRIKTEPGESQSNLPLFHRASTFFALTGDKGISDDEEFQSCDLSSMSSGDDELEKQQNETTNSDSIIDPEKEKNLLSEKKENLAEVQQNSFFEDIDQFEIKDSELEELDFVSKKKIIKSALDGLISIKKARSKLTKKLRSDQVDKMLGRFKL